LVQVALAPPAGTVGGHNRFPSRAWHNRVTPREIQSGDLAVLEYMFLPFRRYADFRGRSRRMEFWAFGLFNVLVYAVIAAIVIGFSGSISTFSEAGANGYAGLLSVVFGGAGILFVLWWLATIIPSIAVTVRRLHDRDMSGWWYLGMVVLSMLPIVGILVSLAFLVITFLPGTHGPNRFGEDPKDPTSAQVFA
jgi:uncharacterized membrane protein YhaH (DUF805 family)